MEPLSLPREQPALLVCGRECRPSVAQSIIDALRAIPFDFRILLPALLAGDAMFDRWCIFVHTVAKRGSAARNYRPLRQAVAWLKQGGLLVVFPAGEFSQWADGNVFSTRPRWSDVSARLAILTGALTFPMVPSGNAAGPASIRVGKPISSTTLKAMPSLRDATGHIRICTERTDPAQPGRDQLVPRLPASRNGWPVSSAG